MEIKLCKMDDGKIAVGTGNRPIEFCRGCYVAVYGDQFKQFKVVIPWREFGIDREDMAIACAKTGEDIYEGGTVWLDPAETSIPALLYAGYIAPVEEPAKPAPKAAKSAEA